MKFKNNDNVLRIDLDKYLEREKKVFIRFKGEDIEVKTPSMRNLLMINQLVERVGRGEIDEMEGYDTMIRIVFGEEVADIIIDELPAPAIVPFMQEVVKIIAGSINEIEEEGIQEDSIEINGELVKIPRE